MKGKMKKFTIIAINCNLEEDIREYQVKSEAAMWNQLRAIRNSLVDTDLNRGARVEVKDEQGNLFKDITFRRNSKGKIEMPNAVKETCRYAKVKAAKVAAAAKAEAKKVAKREADRRYREKKKAAKAAAAQAEATK